MEGTQAMERQGKERRKGPNARKGRHEHSIAQIVGSTYVNCLESFLIVSFSYYHGKDPKHHQRNSFYYVEHNYDNITLRSYSRKIPQHLHTHEFSRNQRCMMTRTNK